MSVSTSCQIAPVHPFPRSGTTYVNVDFLSVTLGSTDRSSNNNQLVLGDEVTDASLVLAAA